ncbi:unnamed protein product [Meloidogyne enterolobii]|uniref:Uncharacterized protein n=1 Tax=Meloidogyne enterolobii TaxID=390850 RepID=A0ACB0ZTW5_MELEN
MYLNFKLRFFGIKLKKEANKESKIEKFKRKMKLMRREKFKNRDKREEKSLKIFKNIDEKKLEKYPNVKQLLEIERFYDKVERCNRFIKLKEEQLNRWLIIEKNENKNQNNNYKISAY